MTKGSRYMPLQADNVQADNVQDAEASFLSSNDESLVTVSDSHFAVTGRENGSTKGW